MQVLTADNLPKFHIPDYNTTRLENLEAQVPLVSRRHFHQWTTHLAKEGYHPATKLMKSFDKTDEAIAKKLIQMKPFYKTDEAILASEESTNR